MGGRLRVRRVKRVMRVRRVRRVMWVVRSMSLSRTSGVAYHVDM